jgi:hypothetical protein
VSLIRRSEPRTLRCDFETDNDNAQWRRRFSSARLLRR